MVLTLPGRFLIIIVSIIGKGASFMKVMKKSFMLFLLCFAVLLGVKTNAAAAGSTIGSAIEGEVEPPAKVTKLKSKKASRKPNSVKLTWKGMSDADGYIVYVYNKKTKTYKEYQTVTSNAAQVKGLKAETKYQFKIAAYKLNADGTRQIGKKSAALSAYTAPKQLKSTKIVSTTCVPNGLPKLKLTLRWNKVSGATGDYVYVRKNASDSWSKIKSVTEVSIL